MSTSPEKLRSHIRDRQQAVDGDSMVGDERRQHARRKVRLWRKKTGMWGLSGDLPDELGQPLRTALDAFDHPDSEAEPGGGGEDGGGVDGGKRRPEQRLVDALAAMTGAVLDGGLAPTTGGIVRPHLSVIVHTDTVSADLARPDAPDPYAPDAAPAPDDPRWADLPPGQLPWGGHLSPQAVRRICCDASVSRIIMAGNSMPLDVGRATRDWSAAQRRAVNARDRGCRGPACTRPIAWTAIHHLVWWSKDGPTAVDNGLALCHHCHRLVHDHGWTVALDPDTATATWTSPTGHTVTTTPGGTRATTRRRSGDTRLGGSAAGAAPSANKVDAAPSTRPPPRRPAPVPLHDPDILPAARPRLDDVLTTSAGGMPRP